MFTVEQRDALRERLLRLAEEDERVVAGAAVGSLAMDGGDHFSDLDLTFGIADHVPVGDVLNHWTRTLIDELDAVHLADLARGPTTYRVFLLPDALQFDLSMTPAAQFRPAGPRFRLLFGETAAGDAEARKPPVAGAEWGREWIGARERRGRDAHGGTARGAPLRAPSDRPLAALGRPHSDDCDGRPPFRPGNRGGNWTIPARVPFPYVTSRWSSLPSQWGETTPSRSPGAAT